MSLNDPVRQRNDFGRLEAGFRFALLVLQGVSMNWYGIIAAMAAMVGFLAGLTPVLAQMTTFRTYHCADGSEFIVGFYP